jgi:hypothetical protein
MKCASFCKRNDKNTNGAMVLTLMKKGHGYAFILVILQMGFAFFGYGASKNKSND